MDKQTVEAFAKAFCVIYHRLDHLSKVEPKPNSIALRANDINMAAMYPARGFTNAMTKALKFHAITDEDNDLIGYFISDVDDSQVQYDKPVSLELQGVWQHTYYRWRKIFTPSKAAEKLGVSNQRVYALIKEGKLDAIKVNGSVYLPDYTVRQRMNSKDVKGMTEEEAARGRQEG